MCVIYFMSLCVCNLSSIACRGETSNLFQNTPAGFVRAQTYHPNTTTDQHDRQQSSGQWCVYFCVKFQFTVCQVSSGHVQT